MVTLPSIKDINKRQWSTMECSRPAALTSDRNIHVASCVKAFSRRLVNPTRPYPELRGWKVAVFSVTGVVNSALHLWLLLLRAGDIELTLGPTCSGCWHHTHCLLDVPPAVASPDRKGVFKALSASSVPGVQLQYLLRRTSPVAAYCHATLCVNSVPTAHTGSTLVYPSVWPTPPCSTLHALYQLPPYQSNPWWLWLTTPTTNMNCLFHQSHTHQTPLSTITHASADSSNPAPFN